MGVQINGSEGNVIATKGTFSGDVGIGGTLTYEDVTNIDSVGLVTARSGIEVGARPGVAASISVDGNMIVSGISTFNNDVKLPDNKKIVLGTGSDLEMYHDGTHTYLNNTTGNLRIQNNGTVKSAQFEVDLIDFNNSDNSAVHVRKEPAGNVNIAQNLKVAGVCTATSFSGSGAALTGITAGITGLDQWYLTSNHTSNGDITSNWSRTALSGTAIPLGTGLSESSGVFSFPNTGKWLVIFGARFDINGADNVDMLLKVTLDNSSYTTVAHATAGLNGSGTKEASATGFYFLDVTDVSNVKVKFSASSVGSGSAITGSSAVITHTTFIRITDT